jgi:glutathione peroxidase
MTFGKMLLVGAFTAALAVSTTITPREGIKMSEPAAKSVYEFSMKDINGKDVKLADYKGKVLLLVNTASQCGYTPQYKGLQMTYQKYQAQGFTVLGFPANNYGGQEPGSNDEIKEFCTMRYKVTFPMFAKISVKGEDQHPLYQYLTAKESNPQFSGDVTWNFNKFLVSKSGQIIGRFGSKVEPESPELTGAIEQALK